MSPTQDTPTEREEIEMLLPWFITGKLDAADKTRVETALTRDPALRRQLDLVREEQGVTIAANEAIGAPRTLSVESGMQAVAARTSLGARQQAAGLMDRLREFFTLPSPRIVQFATAAAVAIVLVQAVAIGSLLSQREDYQTASGSAARGATVIVKFVDDASAQTIASTLHRLNMSIVDGPKPGGTFVVRLGPEGLSQADRRSRIEELRKASEVIGLVVP